MGEGMDLPIVSRGLLRNSSMEPSDPSTIKEEWPSNSLRHKTVVPRRARADGDNMNRPGPCR
jgi:hypothetical protein